LCSQFSFFVFFRVEDEGDEIEYIGGGYDDVDIRKKRFSLD